MVTVVKNTRVETRERNGRIQEATVTTWDLVDGDTILGEFTRKRDAVAKLRQRAQLQTEITYGIQAPTEDDDLVRKMIVEYLSSPITEEEKADDEYFRSGTRYPGQ